VEKVWEAQEVGGPTGERARLEPRGHSREGQSTVSEVCPKMYLWELAIGMGV
jgi:hypothetical protein